MYLLICIVDGQTIDIKLGVQSYLGQIYGRNFYTPKPDLRVVEKWSTTKVHYWAAAVSIAPLYPRCDSSITWLK